MVRFDNRLVVIITNYTKHSDWDTKNKNHYHLHFCV